VPTPTAQQLLGRQPGREPPARRRDWQRVEAALERLAEQRARTREPDLARARDRSRVGDWLRAGRQRRPAGYDRADR
jgi:hypothetical protein